LPSLNLFDQKPYIKVLQDWVDERDGYHDGEYVRDETPIYEPPVALNIYDHRYNGSVHESHQSELDCH
jgi:hypothetical protein